MSKVQEDDASALIASAQAADLAGHRIQARKDFEKALCCLCGPEAARHAADVLRWIARSYITDADLDAAYDCAEASLAVAVACGDKTAEGHAINVHAAIHWASGRLEDAEALFRVARACGLATGERALVAMTSHNLGTIANIRGDLAEALHHYTAGLENYRALGRPHDVCFALNNLGRLYVDATRWRDAERAYAEAVEIATTTADCHTRIAVEVNVAEMWVAREDDERAVAALDAATALSDEIGDAVWLPLIAKCRGVLLRNAGRRRDAESLFDQAIDAAETRHDQLLLAKTLRERAELYRADGRNRDALIDLNRSHRLFTGLSAKRDLANIHKSVQSLEEEFVDLVERWGESIEAKDRYTQGHCVRVANLACAVASQSGIDPQSLFWFRIGALLHDVGKIVVPSEVLNKPGKLSPEEWEVMRRHPTAGVEMLSGIDFPWDVRPLIESHHERWDGAGYPHGAQGDAIPLSARILAIADVYDALTSLRSYKNALSHEAAMDIMRRDNGTAFDPALFATFERVVREAATTEPMTASESLGVTRTTGRSTVEAIISDTLTGLPGRASIGRIAVQALEDARTLNRRVALLVLQLDPSPQSTSVARRRALQWTAETLQRTARSSDFVARTAYNQFMILLPDTQPHLSESIRARLEVVLTKRKRSRAAGMADGTQYRLSVTHSLSATESAGDLLERAEEAIASPDAAVANATNRRESHMG